MVQNLVALCFFFLLLLFLCRDFLAHTKLENLNEQLLAGQHGKAKRKRGCKESEKKKNYSRGMQSERWFSHGCMYRRRVHKKLLVKSLCAQVCERKNSVNYGHCCFHQVYFLISFQLKY